ncbi:MAG: ribulose-phosphate 3-epimerase [Proteobacteria bacterium]|nr:ribulose-phosphate 3-epimerase [Cystobacterineae bacterium]MCL2259094.1 ribulose-phosphate 3-epimerase [Cystobacterineae bacterium]MCL2314487.1 ribulose-phosphate 3-epimerase [Pseudomonadota bacterium]
MPCFLAPSLLSANFGKLAEEIRIVEEGGADILHLDVMDGHFVPNISIGPLVVEAVRRVTRLPLDVHLMIEEPDRYLADFIAAGADRLSVHVEACTHLNRTLTEIRRLGAQPGVALNPSTPLGAIEEVLDEVFQVVLMSVNPGFGGQKFIFSSLKKIARLRFMLDQRRTQGGKEPLWIQVDGGVNAETAPQVLQAGADILVAGHAIFRQPDYVQAMVQLRQR